MGVTGNINYIELNDSDEAFRTFDDMIKCGLQDVRMFQTCYTETDITQLAMFPHTEKNV
jgi:aryl carrier-like protein